MKFMQIKPQKCRGHFTESMWADPAWSAENKEDGDRRIAQFGKTGGARIRFTGTRKSVDGTGFVEKTGNLPHLNELDGRLDGTVLDGEIVYPGEVVGGGSKYVTRVMGSLPERAVALQKETGWLEYVVFDCLWWKGEDVRADPYHRRIDIVYEALKLWKNPHARQIHSYNKESEKRRAWESAPEGLVFKHEDHTYGDERLWVKLKKEATADVVAMDWKRGKGKYTSFVGSIIFGQHINGKLTVLRTKNGKPCAARGFDDATMREMSTTKGWGKTKGRVFRIKHNGREPTGAFRHPRFDGWRDDKSPEDCVYDPEET